MLNRREFLKVSSAIAAGAAIMMSTGDAFASVPLREQNTRPNLPLYRYHGHARSGCAFRPELTDIWHGGGAALPLDF